MDNLKVRKQFACKFQMLSDIAPQDEILFEALLEYVTRFSKVESQSWTLHWSGEGAYWLSPIDRVEFKYQMSCGMEVGISSESFGLAVTLLCFDILSIDQNYQHVRSLRCKQHLLSYIESCPDKANITAIANDLKAKFHMI